MLSWVGREDLVEWEIMMTAQAEAFLDDLYDNDRRSHQLVNQAILVLERNGPCGGQALRQARARCGSCSSSIRGGRAVLLIAGDKSGQWTRWYRIAIPQAEQLYEDYLAEREKEAGR